MSKIKIPKFEDQHNEFKERISNLEKEISAFANSSGGRIFIGVDDRGEVKPLAKTNRLRSQLIQIISNCDPRPEFEIEEQGDIFILHIHEGQDKPYKAPSGFYIRNGASSQKLTRDEIIQFFINENQIHFDSQIIDTVSALDLTEYLDVDELQRFKESASYLRKLSNKELLLNFNLAKEGLKGFELTNASVLLFAKNPQKWFRQSRILLWQMANPIDILDHKVASGNLQNQLSDALSYIRANLRTQYKIENVQRTEVDEFPIDVLRELILNQIIHRDYFEQGADIQIKIFPEKIEFSNPAILPPGKEPGDMIGSSYRRNPLLAETFQRLGLIERAGTGLLRVQQEIQQLYGFPLLLSHEAVYFVVTLKRPNAQEMLYGAQEETGIINKITSLLAYQPNQSSQEISKNLDTPVRTIRTKLKELIEKGAIKQKKIGRKVLYSLK